MPFQYATPLHRILANSTVSKTLFYDGTPCLLWTGSTITNRTGNKYGRVGLRWKRGPRKGKGRVMFAHRYVVQHVKRRHLGNRMRVRHLCNRTLCVNPYHLVGGTQRTNVRQAVREGRHKTPYRRSRGERYTAARAT